MKRYLMAIVVMAFAMGAFAADPAKLAPPPGSPPVEPQVPVVMGGGTSTAAFCDVTYRTDGTVQLGVDKSTGEPILKYLGFNHAFAAGMPIADADDNDKRGIVVIKLISEAQNQGGPYSGEVGTYRNCNGITTRVAANSIAFSGVKARDWVKINREAIKITNDINNQRYGARATKGDKNERLQDHKGAPDFTTDEFGRPVIRKKK